MIDSPTIPRVKYIPHKEFARRLAQACDSNPHVPLPNHGRLQWFVTQMSERFGVSATNETVRKWLAGETMPRAKPLKKLAELLEVDEAWLSLGVTPTLDSKQQKLRNAEADGIVNVVAGFIQMCGSNPAFPAEGDARATKEHIDLYAIIRGAQYAFHVVLASDGVFTIPRAAENTFVIGVIRTGQLSCDFYEIPHEALSEGKTRGGYIEVSGVSGFRQIVSFSERL